MPSLSMGVEDFGLPEIVQKFLKGQKPEQPGMGALSLSDPNTWKSDPKDTSPAVDNRSSGSLDPKVDPPVAPDPSASKTGESAGMGSVDMSSMVSDPKDKGLQGIEIPQKAPTIAPPAGTGKGEGAKSDFTQQDPNTGKTAAPATDEHKPTSPDPDQVMIDKLEAERAKMPDPSTQAHKDMGPRPEQHKMEGMSWLLPLIGGLLGGSYGFEGVAGGLKEGADKELKTTQDYDKRLTELTADYRKETDTNNRAILVDQIKVLRDHQQALIANRKAAAVERRNDITAKHNDDTARLRQLGIETTGSIADARIASEQAHWSAQESGKDEDRAIAAAKEADYHSKVTAEIFHMVRSDEIRGALKDIAAKRVNIAQAKEVGAVLARHYDAMGNQLERLQGDLALTHDKSARDRINAQIDELKKERENLHGEMEKVNLYKEPEVGLTGTVIPPPMNASDFAGSQGADKVATYGGHRWSVVNGAWNDLGPIKK